MSWLDGLNQLSPDSSPANGLNDPSFDLSFPLNASELQRQLDAWTNVSFAIDPPNKRPSEYDDDDFIHKSKNASAASAGQHSQQQHDHTGSALDFSFAGLGQSTMDPSLSLGASLDSPHPSDSTSPRTSGASHPLAFANMLALPAQREANRQARDAQAHSIQSHTSALFHQPLNASYSLPMGSVAATAGLAAGQDPFLGLLPIPTISAGSAPPSALQQHPLPPQPVTSLPAPPSRAQQQANSKPRARTSSTAKNHAGAASAEGNTGSAARRASTGAAALRNNSSAKSGVGTQAAVSAAAEQQAPTAWAPMAVVKDQPLADPVAEAERQDDLNKVAIEEDKRRRNTAASARFRVKKKQREQALEASASALRDRVAELEKEVENLKQENGWLRGLVVEKTSLVPGAMPGASESSEVLTGRKRAREDDEESDGSFEA